VSLWRLVIKEILHRKLNVALALLSTMVAAGSLVGALTLLRVHDRQTEAIVAEKQAETEKRMKHMEDEYRKITKRMGFNVLILPKGQNLADLYAEGYAAKHMPEEYVKRLAGSRILTVRHLLPMLEHKVKWPEQKRTILLVGTRGEVPLLHRAPKKAILQAVEPGTMVVGHELHRGLSLKPGSKVTLLGREFTVNKCYPERGTRDDITVWIDLAQAQEMLDKKGLINGILALECQCAWANLPKVRSDVQRILPDTQVVEQASKALARAETRVRARQTAEGEVAAEKQARAQLRRQRESFAAVLVPIVVVASAVWIGLLMFGNVRERRTEIGILRAVGVRARSIFLVFLAKAALVGFVGALAGYVVGVAAGLVWVEGTLHAPAGMSLVDPWLLLCVALAAPLVAVLASWVPATIAAAQQPAVILREE